MCKFVCMDLRETFDYFAEKRIEVLCGVVEEGASEI